MRYEITIVSINEYKEIEWTQVFECSSKSSARAKATRWINNNLFEEEKSALVKQDTDISREYWVIK